MRTIWNTVKRVGLAVLIEAGKAEAMAQGVIVEGLKVD